MYKIENLIINIIRRVLRVTAKGKIKKLGGSNGVLSLLGETLNEALQNKISGDELRWIDKIERMREKLISSREKISIVDYGASKREDTHGHKQYEGKIVNRTIGTIARRAGKPYFWSLFLFKLIRKFKPEFCLELGTSLGISASFQAAALKLNGGGEIVTLEGAGTLASLAESHFSSLELDNIKVITGKFKETLKEVLRPDKLIDFAFIDRHHDEKATLEYFNEIFPFLSDKAIVVFDDISWSAGMKNAWRKIAADERVKISLNLRQMGICVIDPQIERKENYSIMMI